VGRLVRELGGNPGVLYVVLQDTLGILSASQGVEQMSRIAGDPFLEEALAGYAQFQQLTQQYAQIVIEQTRQQLAGVGVKPGPRPNSSWRKRKKSGN
jgi:hypothetical protein